MLETLPSSLRRWFPCSCSIGERRQVEGAGTKGSLPGQRSCPVCGDVIAANAGRTRYFIAKSRRVSAHSSSGRHLAFPVQVDRDAVASQNRARQQVRVPWRSLDPFVHERPFPVHNPPCPSHRPWLIAFLPPVRLEYRFRGDALIRHQSKDASINPIVSLIQ